MRGGKFKMENNEYLAHYGILGMKWGVRRYQNKDGTLTPAGKRRYADPDPSYAKAHNKKNKVKYMSDKDLTEINKRLNLEKNYKELTRKKKKGKAAVDAFVKTAGTLSAVAGAYATYKTILGPMLKKAKYIVI